MKKFIFLGFHAVASTREDPSIDVSITNVTLTCDIDEARVISFSRVRTDGQDTLLESWHGNMLAHTKNFHSKIKISG